MTKILEEEATKKSFEDIAAVLTRAIQKVGGKKENDLCRYLPMKSGGYMHHFTLKKMKSKQPKELSSLIQEFILNQQSPSTVAPKQRAARGSRKKKDLITFTKPVLERLLSLAKSAGDKEVVSMLRPSRSLASIKRELIQSIRQNRIDADLWSAYTDVVGIAPAQAFTNPFQD